MGVRPTMRAPLPHALVIAGVEPNGGRVENCWHTRVERALTAAPPTLAPVSRG